MSNVLNFFADVVGCLNGKSPDNKVLDMLSRDENKYDHIKGWHPNAADHDGGSIDTAIGGSVHDDQLDEVTSTEKDSLFTFRFKF